MSSNSLKKLKMPMLREISFEGNHPSSYERDLKKALEKSASKKKAKRRGK